MQKSSILRRFFIRLVLLSIVFSTSVLAGFGAIDMDDIVYPDDEPHSAAEIELGKTLFFDRRLSRNFKQSCASCHNPDLGFGDAMAKGLGSMGLELSRNTPPLYNLAWNEVFFWDGRASSLEEQALGPIEAEGEMNLPLKILLPRLQAVPYYRKAFGNVYGVTKIGSEQVGRALAAFERSLVSKNTPFDRYLAGVTTALSPAAIRGMEIFKGKGDCIQCHDGPNFTDGGFYNLGITNQDAGRASTVGDDSLWGAFKTPGLRNVLFTAPYMHDGSEATLEAVVRFYNLGGGKSPNKDKLIVPLELTDQDVLDLVAFMGALTEKLSIVRPEIPADKKI